MLWLPLNFVVLPTDGSWADCEGFEAVKLLTVVPLMYPLMDAAVVRSVGDVNIEENLEAFQIYVATDKIVKLAVERFESENGLHTQNEKKKK